MLYELGIGLALLCALGTNVSFLCRHRGACAVETVSIKRPLRSAGQLLGSKWFGLGMVIAVGAWLLHVAALAVAPLSLVQAVIAGGLVFVGVLAERYFGFKLGRRQWFAIAAMTAGLVLLAVITPATGGAHAAFSPTMMLVGEATLLASGIALALSPKLGLKRYRGVSLGAAAGILFTVSDVAIKALTGSVEHGGVLGLVSPWIAPCIAASVIAFYASARSLQHKDGVAVIATTAAAANVSAMVSGIVIFGDPLAGYPLGVIVQAVAFALIVGAAAIIPAPLRVGKGRLNAKALLPG